MATDDIALMAHLMRRAGFGAPRPELEARAAAGYEATVEELLAPDEQEPVDILEFLRYHPSHWKPGTLGGVGQTSWVYRMIVTNAPLQEKMTLFWHQIFATGVSKVDHYHEVTTMVDMFREMGMGKFRDIVTEVAKNPAMIYWLDNHENHSYAVNENWGRELLELFSMGVGNYTEDDIKECARAFTGWSVVNPDYMSIKMRNNTARPYGYISWQFEYNDDDHDHGEKTLLGETGDFNGEDAVAIICKQEATARFIARHLYHFFVADELPVPQWPHTPPRDPEAIDVLVQAYFDSGYSIGAMLRALFTSDFFKAEASQFARIKSPAEMVVGTLRLAGGVELPSQDTYAASAACSNMGQGLLAPPSVEGWQGGSEWINTGAYVQRVNFASKMLNDPSRPGVKAIIERVAQFAGSAEPTPEQLVDACLDVLGPLEVLDSTHAGLVDFAASQGRAGFDEDSEASARTVAALISIIVATQEYQMA